MSNDLSRPVVDVHGQSEGSRAMNAWIKSQSRRGERLTATASARLGGSPSDSESLGDRLANLDARRKAALERGDADELGLIDHQTDLLFAEARAQREQPRDEQGQFASFDGGVQGRRTVRGPAGMTAPSSRELMAQAMAANHRERIERGAERTIVARNF